MLSLVILAPLVLSSLSIDIRDQRDDEFDFDRLPRRPAPIPDDDEMLSGGALNRNLPNRNSASRDLLNRGAPRESGRQPKRQSPAFRAPRSQTPPGPADLARSPLKYVFAGSRGRFSLIGGLGQAAYQRQQQSFLTGLRYVRRDERFSYWSAAEGDPSVAQWAFSRRATPDGSHAVWLRTPAGWQYFDQALVSKPR